MRALILFFAVLLTGVDLPMPSPAAPVSAGPSSWDAADEAAADQFAHLERADVACIALAVFAEARGEPFDGQALVADVVLNRAESEQRSACDIVQAEGQFAVADWPLPRRPWRIDPAAWQRAIVVAQAVASGDYYIPPPCQGATFFWRKDGAAPAWAGASVRLLCEVGDHAFFAQDAGPVVAATGR